MTNEEGINGLEVLKQIPHAKNYIEHINMGIKALKQTKWIPCSERLPEKNIEVLVTTKWGCITIGEVVDNDDWLIYEGTTYANSEGIKIIAWMPLPQPYKAESEEII